MKNLTDKQIKELAKEYGIDYAGLKAVIEVEAKGSGYINGLPKILYEPHIMYKLLSQQNKYTIRNQLIKDYPKLCYLRWGTHKYDRESEQHNKLSIASRYDRDCALQSCSWGIGQVMGFNWKILGYTSLQEFVNAMYESEAKQLEAMIRFIKTNDLVSAINRQDWHRFAKGYNGSGYAKNQYHIKLAKAYNKYK